jgi:hypothetical protein
MTTAEHASAATTSSARTVAVAGVPWPLYKLVALLVGAIAFGIVAVTAGAMAPAVLTGAGVATLVWAGVPLVASLTR